MVTLLDLKNAFGEVHPNLIPVVLDYHHVPSELIECIMSLNKDFATTVVTHSYKRHSYVLREAYYKVTA